MRREEFPAMGFSDQKQMGLLAQEVEQILPGIVHTGANGYKGIDYVKLVPLLIEAIKETKKENNELEKKLEAISQKLDMLIGKN